ncbi:MAG: outer membrane protein assembly factor BamC [Burkholderiaceae bacterium]|nr:outer membrane protein assembly factor BamC [Burkholderiaceae bacterium]
MHVVFPRVSAGNTRRGAAARWLVILAAGLVAGCSSLGISSDKVDYKAVPPQRPLDLPPDLPPPPSNERFTVPGVATASGTAQQIQRPAPGPVAAPAAVAVAPTASNARIERAGAQRWLAVDLPPEQAFAVAREFWGSVGIKLEREDPAVTEWAENRAKIPQDIIRRTIGKVFDGLYSTGERDKFRTRIERTPANTSEIFISHRGMIEVYTTSQQDQTKWQPRPTDTELEAEMLQRLLLRFAPAMPTFVAAGAKPPGSPAVAPAVATTAAPPAAPAPGSAPAAAASVATVAPTAAAQNVRMITGGDGRVAGGFTVEDRNRTNGVYFVRYLDPEFEAKQRAEQGVLSKLFGGDPKIVAQQFRIQVGTTAAAGTTSTITLLDRDGKPEASATGDKILRQLSEQIR